MQLDITESLTDSKIDEYISIYFKWCKDYKINPEIAYGSTAFSISESDLGHLVYCVEVIIR